MMIDQQSQDGQAWLETLVQLMGLSTEVRVESSPNAADPSSLWLVIDESKLSAEQIQSLIGPKGAGIDAIQYLTNTLVNLGIDRAHQHPFTVELGGYRQQRLAEIMTQVHQVAERVRANGQEIEIPDLSSAERRQVHTLLQDVADLVTESRGQEPDRRLVVKPR
jgi:spoIIIJ-associated protein